MKLWSKENLSGAGVLVVALMGANFLNFVFNAFLGRQLSYEQFGLLTFYNTILSLSAIFFGGLASTVNYRTAYLSGKYNSEAGGLFAKFVRNRSLIAVAILWVLWLALIPIFSAIFKIDNAASLFLFSPIFLFGTVAAINRGYLQGNLHFIPVALIILAEPLMKLLSGTALVFLHQQNLVYLAIPISLLTALVLSGLLMFNKTKGITGENQFRFPKRFYSAAVVTGLSTAAFLSVDVILAKHYLSPGLAGEYAILSLVGKIVYFFGGLLNVFMLTFVAHERGEHQNTRKTFHRLLAAAFLLTAVAVLAFGFFGEFTVPLLFGTKAMPILPFLDMYTVAIGLFTLGSVIVLYHLALEEYIFSIAAFVGVGVLSLGIFLNHDGISDFVRVIFFSSIFSLALFTVLHMVQRNRRFFFSNLIDLLNLFKPLPVMGKPGFGSKRILIFNWRDTKHKFAGGAEVYIHELAKRWVKAGHQVTQFCGNDGNCLRDERVDGVSVLRRGGFYFVYPWAVLYYIAKFRGQFDLIIDCQNGVPFFTPLYAKEPVYCLLFHVHQEIFNKYLPKPLAAFASVLENRLVPYAYRHTKFITISESTKKDMENLDIVGSGIEVVFPGVDLVSMKPGEKSSNPSVLYLGRLKAYKSVHILIQAFKQVKEKFAEAELWIAGSGEEHLNLSGLALELGLESSVKFLGKVPERQKISLMQQAWVFVNPSMMEGWGITTIEANACGTPVVASDVPGLRDSVHNPHTGFLVKFGDPNELSAKIIELFANKGLRENMAKNALKWAKQFNWDLSSKKGLEVMYVE